jgi:hypothetical protein
MQTEKKIQSKLDPYKLDPDPQQCRIQVQIWSAVHSYPEAPRPRASRAQSTSCLTCLFHYMLWSSQQRPQYLIYMFSILT